MLDDKVQLSPPLLLPGGGRERLPTLIAAIQTAPRNGASNCTTQRGKYLTREKDRKDHLTHGSTQLRVVERSGQEHACRQLALHLRISLRNSGKASSTEVFRRLRKPLRIESFFNWRSVALITLEAGCPVHTGSVCCERYWTLVLGYLPRHVTRMSSAWWEMLAQLSFCKHNYQHFSAGGLARIAERDAEVQSKLATCMLLTRALHDSELCGAMGFNDLFLFASEVLAPLRGAVTCPVAWCSLDRSGDQRRQEFALPPPTR